MKKLFIGALIALTTISFVACGNDTQSSNNTANTNDTVTTEVAQEDNNKAEEEAEAKEKAEKEAKEKAEAEKKAKEEEARLKAEAEAKEEEDAFNAAINLIEKTCQNNGFTYINVTGDYSTKTIHVNVGMDGVAQDMVLVKATGTNMDAYYSLEDTVINTCKTMHDTFGYHIAYNIVNDINPDNVLLSTLDGSVIYSYMNE